jgi:hypothetical protein
MYPKNTVPKLINDCNSWKLRCCFDEKTLRIETWMDLGSTWRGKIAITIVFKLSISRLASCLDFARVGNRTTIMLKLDTCN